MGCAVGFWSGEGVLVVLSDWAAWGRSRALWSPMGGTIEGLPPLCLSSWSATGLSSVLPSLSSPWESRHHPDREQTLVQVMGMVMGSPCPTPETAVG